MSWILAVILRVITASILNPIFYKKLADSRKEDRIIEVKKINLLFFFCSLFAVLMLLLTMKDTIHFTAILFIGTLGIFNALANLLKFKTVGINMTKSYLFSQGRDIIAMALSYIAISEMRIFDPMILFGIALCFLTSIILIAQKKSENGGEKSNNFLIVKYAIYFSLIWGILQFFQGYFALKKLPVGEFLTGWYGGSYIGCLFLIKIVKATERGRNPGLNKKEVRYAFLAAIWIWTSLLLTYYAFWKSYLTIVLPIFTASGVIFPCLLGLFYFKDRKYLTQLEKLAILTGFTGAIIIAITFKSPL